MRNPTRWRKLLYLALACAVVFAGGMLHTPLGSMRSKWSRRTPKEGFPPSLVLGTQMLGSFRGMLVVGLWLRATTLQEEGRYYELMQLYDWITQLEPGLESVWSYAGWNASYNISVAMDTPEERWRWVQNGLSILRDRGLYYNPRSYLLHHHLSWIYFHKVGATSDEMHWYYQREFPKALHAILGGPEPDYKAFADALADEQKLLKSEAIAALLKEARAAGFDPLAGSTAWLNDFDKLPEDVRPIFEAAKETPAFKQLENLLRAKALKEDWKIDPTYVQGLIKEFGPLDFRIPVVHALYWGMRSLEPEVIQATDNRMHGERMVYFSLVEICERGRLIYDGKNDFVDYAPDLRFIDPTTERFKEIIALEGEKTGVDSAFKHWTRNMVATLFVQGQKERAEKLRQALYDFEPRPEHEGPVEAFVVREVEDDLKGGQYQQVAEYIRAHIFQSYYWEALGDEETSQSFLLLAKLFYDKFKDKAPQRISRHLGTWEEELRLMLFLAIHPQRGFPKPLRDVLRELYKDKYDLPSEDEMMTPPAEPEDGDVTARAAPGGERVRRAGSGPDALAYASSRSWNRNNAIASEATAKAAP